MEQRENLHRKELLIWRQLKQHYLFIGETAYPGQPEEGLVGIQETFAQSESQQ